MCIIRYEMVYRQAVSSEDMFLQLGNKTPMTSSCEELVVSHCCGCAFVFIKY